MRFFDSCHVDFPYRYTIEITILYILMQFFLNKKIDQNQFLITTRSLPRSRQSVCKDYHIATLTKISTKLFFVVAVFQNSFVVDEVSAIIKEV